MGAGGWSRCMGQWCPAPVLGRSCWPASCQAPLIQGVSHIQCPPRRPLSPPAWCRFHTRQEHHKGVCVWGGWGSVRGGGLCLQLVHKPSPHHTLQGLLPPLFRPTLITPNMKVMMFTEHLLCGSQCSEFRLPSPTYMLML